MFELEDTVTIDGKSYNIRTDFRVILEIFVMLNDLDLDDGDKTEALMQMFYIDRPEDTGKAIQAFSSFVDPRPGKQNGRSGLVDWETDFELIAAAVNHVLGTECRSLPYLHWRSFLGAYMEISSESLFTRVISIRDKLRTGKKMEKWEKAWYRKNRDLVDLPMKFSDNEPTLLKEWT